MPNPETFQATFQRLKSLLEPFAPALVVQGDGPTGYSLSAPRQAQAKQELFFGGVQIQKKYVSYYLMPVYMFPEMLEEVSDRLKKRMQGKSCFNFTTLDEELITELGLLTERAFARLRQKELVPPLPAEEPNPHG